MTIPWPVRRRTCESGAQLRSHQLARRLRGHLLERRVKPCIEQTLDVSPNRIDPTRASTLAADFVAERAGGRAIGVRIDVTDNGGERGRRKEIDRFARRRFGCDGRRWLGGSGRNADLSVSRVCTGERRSQS
jgi:hypothetical protein